MEDTIYIAYGKASTIHRYSDDRFIGTMKTLFPVDVVDSVSIEYQAHGALFWDIRRAINAVPNAYLQYNDLRTFTDYAPIQEIIKALEANRDEYSRVEVAMADDLYSFCILAEKYMKDNEGECILQMHLMPGEE